MNDYNRKKDCMSGDCTKSGAQKHLKGISCDVKNCIHHDGECYCCAEHISVGPSYATNCSDTVCATFKQKNS